MKKSLNPRPEEAQYSTIQHATEWKGFPEPDFLFVFSYPPLPYWVFSPNNLYTEKGIGREV